MLFVHIVERSVSLGGPILDQTSASKHEKKQYQCIISKYENKEGKRVCRNLLEWTDCSPPAPWLHSSYFQTTAIKHTY